MLFGYNRDCKRGHEQVVLGLLCNEEGCPVGVEVFAGNTQDAATVVAKVHELKQQYGLKEVIFVGDRGMVTSTNVDKLNGVEGLHTISALTHRQIVELLERNVIEAELFDEKQIVEVQDPQDPKRRYCLCRNPKTADREHDTRQRLLDLTRAGLARMAGRKRRSKTEKLAAQVGKLLSKYKTGKFVSWEIKRGRLHWEFKEALIAQEQLFDGCYIISSDVPTEEMDHSQVVAAYRKLALVEQAFRNLKTVALEIRPVYHKKDHRIRSHVFLCVLAYYLQWHMQQRLQPLFAQDGVGKNREWTLENVLERLKAIRRDRVQVAGVEFDQVTGADEEQERILELLKVKL